NQLLYFTNLGKVYMQQCFQIPEAGRQAKGTAIVNLLNLDPNEKISNVFPVAEFEEDAHLVMITKGGVIKKTEMSAFANIRQNGLIAVGLREGDELIAVLKTDGKQNIIVGTQKGMSITFSETDVRPMGRTATGVRAIMLREGDAVIGAGIIQTDKQVLVITENGYGKRTYVEEYKEQIRGGIGVKTMNITEKTGLMCGILVVDGTEDLMLISDAGIVIRMKVEEISIFGRDTQGVRLMKIEEGTRVVCVERIVEDEEADSEAEEETVDGLE
ncbi:MAG: DNA gyrase C-terminal beta-propeller domain-containing protein, partial [Eubacteriales bacterium]